MTDEQERSLIEIPSKIDDEITAINNLSDNELQELLTKNKTFEITFNKKKYFYDINVVKQILLQRRALEAGEP